jgi:hypothetical protein
MHCLYPSDTITGLQGCHEKRIKREMFLDFTAENRKLVTTVV